MTANPTFDLRLVAYTPLGARIGPIPDLGFTITDTDAGPTLTAKVSTVIAGTLPQSLEVAVENWRPAATTDAAQVLDNADGTATVIPAPTDNADGTATSPYFVDNGDGTASVIEVTSLGRWAEGRDSRFAVTQVNSDDRDRTGTVTLTGLGVAAYLFAANSLAGVEPYQAVGNVEAAATKSNVTVSGTTYTWPSHVLAAGDRVRVVAKGNAKNLNTGSVYYVKNPTASTFQLAVASGGTAINGGSATNLSLSRVRTRIVFSGADVSKFTRGMAISVLNAAGSNLTDGSTYYVVNPSATMIQVASQPGGTPIELNANNLTVYRFLDGQRIFNSVTPGQLMSSVFLEARTRGWGVGPTDYLTHSWTVGADSYGNAWATMADDPATPGVSVGFQPGTPATQVLQFLLDNQYAEWFTAGRIIGLLNYGSGTDYTVGATPRRIGTSASSVQVQSDATGVRNAYTVRGTGPVLIEKDATPTTGGWARLETYETASGANSTSLASKQASTDLTANQAPTVAYTVTENAAEALWLPAVDYSRGDWVAVQLAGTGWTRLRVVGWSYTKTPGSPISVSVNLAAIERELLTKLTRAVKTQVSGITGTSTGVSLLESDNRKAAPPAGLALTSIGSFANDGSAVATVTATWLPVTSDIAGGDLTVTEYDVWVRAAGAFNGQSAGHTSAVSMDAGPYPSNHTYAVSVRAKSATGQWGEFCGEVEVVTAYPVTIPNPPTAPTVSGKLGSVRVAWDGNLVDPTLGVEAPERGFAYVYAAYSTTQTGTYIPAGSNMGNAGYTPITGLAIGSTYWFALFAVNSIGVISTMSPAVQFTVVGVKGPDIEANSVTSNTILAGAITADKLDVGTVPQGTPTDRVPMPVTSTAFWDLALAGPPVVSRASSGSVTPTSAGIEFASSTTEQAVMWVTQQVAAPASKVLHLSGLSTYGVASFMVQESDASGTTTDTNYPLTPSGVIADLAATTATYSVLVRTNGFTISDTVEAVHVFEVIGAGGGGQAAELSPSGLRLYDSNGVLALDLTTASKQFLNVYDNTGPEPVSVASIDDVGNAQFSEVSGDGFDIGGLTLTDSTSATSLVNSAPNQSSWPAVPLLDRLGRGAIYDVTWPSQDGVTVTTQYRRIAQDQFTLEDGRSYAIHVELAGLQAVNGTTTNIYVEFQLNTVPNATVQSGTVFGRSVVFAGASGYWTIPPIIVAASANTSTLDLANRVVPAGVPLYWQVNTNMSATPNVSYLFGEYGGSRGVTVVDLGSANLTRPDNGADSLADVHDYSTSGGSSGSTSGGTTASSTTKTWTAAWSRSWHDSGNTIVTGTGQYTNGAALYQGNGVTPMGAQFGFPALGISGKTITACSIYLRNTYFAYSGKSALLGSHGNSSPPATYTGSRQNEFNVGWGQGQGKWVSVPSSLWASIASGSIRGFSLGVDGSDGNYAIFAGATQSGPPQLKVTFH